MNRRRESRVIPWVVACLLAWCPAACDDPQPERPRTADAGLAGSSSNDSTNESTDEIPGVTEVTDGSAEAPPVDSTTPSEDAGAQGRCGQAGEQLFVSDVSRLAGCTHLLGSLIVKDVETVDLSALNSLERIDGDLILWSVSVPLPLARLQHVAGHLGIHSLLPPSGLETVETVGHLWMYDIGQDPEPNLNVLQGLRQVTGSVIARRNTGLSSDALQLLLDGVTVLGTTSIADGVTPSELSPEEIVCGTPAHLPPVAIDSTSELVGCTRCRGWVHLPDVFAPSAIAALSTLTRIDDSLSLFRNHTQDFSPLTNLRSVGGELSLNQVNIDGLHGLEHIAEIGALLLSNLQGTDLGWVSPDLRVREYAVVFDTESADSSVGRRLLSAIQVDGYSIVFH